MALLNGNKILIGPSSFGALNQEPLDRLLNDGWEVIDNPYKRKLTESELEMLLAPDVVGLVAGLEPLGRGVLSNCNLKVISRCGSGMSNVDMVAARELGISVFSTPFGPTNAVAELTLGCLLSLLRELTQIDQSMHSRVWDKRIGAELRGKKVAIIGHGRIGQRIGKLLLAFDAETIAVDPDYRETSPSVKKMALEDAVKCADIITIHSSGSDCILGKREFGLMKNGVFILNAARGELIDEEQLAHSLDTGKVAGAWLDTFSHEPYTGPLCNYSQVILTPHIGSYTLECRLSMEMEAVENLLKGLHSD